MEKDARSTRGLNKNMISFGDFRFSVYHADPKIKKFSSLSESVDMWITCDVMALLIIF